MSELEDYVMPEGYGTTIGKCLTFGEIEALLAAERERCAKVAEDLATEAMRQSEGQKRSVRAHLEGLASSTRFLARAIRNLPPQTDGGKT